VGARHGAELSVSHHAHNLPRRTTPVWYGFWTYRHALIGTGRG
jgi:hypothetical protein